MTNDKPESEMTTTEQVLRECPFCNSDDIDPSGWMSHVDLTDQGTVTGPSCMNCGSTAESIEIWDARPTCPAVAALVDMLEDIFLHTMDMGDHYMISGSELEQVKNRFDRFILDNRKESQS